MLTLREVVDGGCSAFAGREKASTHGRDEDIIDADTVATALSAFLFLRVGFMVTWCRREDVYQTQKLLLLLAAGSSVYARATMVPPWCVSGSKSSNEWLQS